MTTLPESQMADSEEKRQETRVAEARRPRTGRERREYRRHDLESVRAGGRPLGRARGNEKGLFRQDRRPLGWRPPHPHQQRTVRADQQIRVRLELPAFAGICPFVDTRADQPQPSRAWVGWLAVARVRPINDNEREVAGRLVDMEEMDRGMLGAVPLDPTDRGLVGSYPLPAVSHRRERSSSRSSFAARDLGPESMRVSPARDPSGFDRRSAGERSSNSGRHLWRNVHHMDRHDYSSGNNGQESAAGRRG